MSNQPQPERPNPARLPRIDLDHLLLKLGETPQGRPSFVHIGGASAAGKSTTARLLASQLPESQVFAIDSYLSERLWDTSRIFNHDPEDPSRPYIAGLSPEIWDFDLMEAHLEELRSSRPIDMPLFDETIKDRVGSQPFAPSKFIIIEGGNSFNDRFRAYADYKILVSASLHDRITRKIVRTHCEYGRDDIDEVLQRYFTKDEPMRRFYEEEHTAMADQVVQNPANPSADFRYTLASSAQVPEGRFHELIPKAETGVPREGESLGVIHTLGDGFSLCYSVDDRLLVNLPITREVFELFAPHYDIK